MGKGVIDANAKGHRVARTDPDCQSESMTGTVEVTENTPALEDTWGKTKSLYR